MKFDELDIHPLVLEGIRAAGFSECTPVQTLTLPEALRGKDIAAQAQTGTGKTAAFLIAVFSRMLRSPASGRGPSPRALIVAPTRELVLQIESEAKVLGGPSGFRIISVFGGMDYAKQREELQRGADIVIGTPGRLIDYLKQKVYSLKKTQFLVIDEADRLFDMGFISDLRFILRRMAPYHQRQSMLYSATLSYRVMELCYEHMNMPLRFTASPDQITVEQIEQGLYHVGRAEKFPLLLGILRQESGGRYLIFCNMKSTAERLKLLLNANRYVSEVITGDLDQKKRLRVLDNFKSGSLPILIATDVASRGLHIEGVTHVINYDLPQDREDYVHRIGRTARAGAGGKAISLACEECVLSLPDIEEYIKQKIPVRPVTDDLIVSDFKKALKSRAERPSPHEQGRRTAKRRDRKFSAGTTQGERQPGTDKGSRPRRRGKRSRAGAESARTPGTALSSRHTHQPRGHGEGKES